ncbi:Retrovirus-related Pol polyprotein from transposon TNT 1-94 [Vitis vinifera]|uniref:Retrovirus-related Pol polyprotein from transposon TNT 1-94 n=1 Tax=Vitis vinifera TaxID=29760 RepID=A0A438I4L7_VITVI|nr:Retrovirus-related Pol polyprotein from transposon TNT 1-94 [Vitis vinifera]
MQVIRSDNGTEYTSEKFNKFCEDAGIEHQMIAPYTPQQNGVVKRKNRTIMEMARSLKLRETNWTKKKAEFGIFVGYSSISKAYMIYLPQSNEVIVSKDVQFLKLDNWSWENDKKLEVQEENDDMGDEPVRGTKSLSDIYQRCNVVVMKPTGYEETATDRKCMAAMEELKMIEKNQTWELVDRPKHKKAIGVKWVYKTKINLNGSVNKYKARLVIKGYAQMFGVDFSETFAPVARLDTIRMLLVLAAQKDWVIHQMDVKSIFLNGYLEEEIFVEQHEIFQEQKEKVHQKQNETFLSQHKYAKEVLKKFNMEKCKPTAIPMNQKETNMRPNKQEVIARSTVEAEYVATAAAAAAVNQALWIMKTHDRFAYGTTRRHTKIHGLPTCNFNC